MPQLKFAYLAWLTDQRPKKKKPTNAVKSKLATGLTKKVKRLENDADNFLNEAGLRAFLRGYRVHQTDFMEQFTSFLIQAGQDSYVDLLTNQLRIYSVSTFEYLGLVQDMYQIMFETKNGRVAFYDSGVFQILVDICYGIADQAYSGSTNLEHLNTS